MLRQMIRMECRKAFRNKMFYIAVAAGCIITLFALVYYIGIYQNELTMMQADDVNPMHEASGLFNFWIGGEPFSFGSAAYFFMFPLLTAFPYGWSYCGEKQAAISGSRWYRRERRRISWQSIRRYFYPAPLQWSFRWCLISFCRRCFSRLLCQVLYTARVPASSMIRLCRCSIIPYRCCMC